MVKLAPWLVLVLVATFLALVNFPAQPTAAHTDHYLQLRPQHSAGDGMCMNVEYGSAYGGEKIILWPCVGAQNEQFTVLHKSNGWHEIKARHSNMCLEVPNGSLGLVQLRQNPCNGQSYQMFQPAPCTGCTGQIRIKHSGQCVNVEGWGGQNARVIQYPCQSPPTANETWLLRDNPPPYAHSWYITRPGATDMYNLGRYVDGPFDNATCAQSVVVLNFGQPDYVNSNYGTNTFAAGNPFISNADTRTAVENYARGWYQGTGTCPRLTIVVGTNNYNQIPSGQGSPAGAGSNWATLVYAIQSYLDTSGYSWQISAWGGSDMEQPSGGELWDCAADTRQFVDGYNGNSLARKFLNYGTAWVPK